jgi:prolyl-tRNA synthetase
MRMTRLFSQTLREAPSDAEVASHRLLVRAGFIRQLAAGIFSYLPLAKRSMAKIENILREEMNAIGGQEIEMPVVHPADLWKETGRWYGIGAEMGRFKDRADRDMVLAMTHEEVVADLVRKEIRSYRQLPALIYHIQTKWRDDPRPRAGLIRVREFTMKDSYTLDADWEGLDRQYRAHYQAYFDIFSRCGLRAVAVRSDVGMMGGRTAHEFMYLTPVGEDTLILCDRCGYSANRQIARIARPPAPEEEPRAVRRVATPNAATIEDLAAFLRVPKTRTAKALFMMAAVPDGEGAKERLVLALIRGDMEVNETKLVNALKASELRPARDDEIRASGAVPGYGSAVGVRGAIVVADESVAGSPNLVGGANEEGYHLENLNYGRDFQADVVADLAVAGEGDPCPDCEGPLRASRGVEVGNIFKLGTRYADAMGCTFLDRDGTSKPVVMGSYGIGVGRLLACIAEEHHDEHGLTWPVTVAPYQLHLVGLSGAGDEVQLAADSLYAELTRQGVEVLYDDREESPGIKFADADLIGIPVRATVSRRTLARDVVELRTRKTKEQVLAPIGDAVAEVKRVLEELAGEVSQGRVEVPFRE